MPDTNHGSGPTRHPVRSASLLRVDLGPEQEEAGEASIPWEPALATGPFCLVVNGRPLAEDDPRGHPIHERIQRGTPWRFRDGVVLIIGGQAHRVMRARWHAEARVLMLNTAPLSNLE